MKSNNPPDQIFHYTTQRGLLGICKSKSIWTTKVLCLNDSSEYILALSLAREILTQLEKTEKYRSENINLIMEALDVIRRLNIFVSSFTENGDLLSQWRAYGNTSGGYSVGFDGKKLAEEAKNQGFFLSKCIYNPGKQREIMTKLLIELIEKEYDFSGYEGSESKFVYLVREEPTITDDLGSIAPIFKNAGFQEENEWRIISDGPKSAKDAKYRCGQSYIIPYFEFSLEKPLDFIKSITIGPSPHPDISNNTLKMLLLKHDKDYEIDVVQSKVPYRNW